MPDRLDDQHSFAYSFKQHKGRNVRIFALGSCLITGFPYVWEHGFFGVCCRELSKYFKLEINMYAMHGSTAHKGLNRISDIANVISGNVVIIQYGNTDVSIPLKSKLHRFWRRITGAKRKKSPFDGLIVNLGNSHSICVDVNIAPARERTKIQWFIEGTIRKVLLMKPKVSANDYEYSIAGLISAVLNNGGLPVVVGPTCFGDYYSDTYSRRYNQIAKLTSQRYHAIFIDSRLALAHKERVDVLLSDGQHLSELGHELIGKEILRTLLNYFSTHTLMPLNKE